MATSKGSLINISNPLTAAYIVSILRPNKKHPVTMPPKKDKKGKKDDKKGKKEDKNAKKDDKETLLEVDKTFYELQLADCNRKLARLRSLVEEYQMKNEELQQNYDKLDEDRADVITYLKKLLNQKTQENAELKEKVKGLEEIRQIETQQFQERIAELDRNFKTMHEQLTSENKLLSGKLNSLEEFRAMRDDLMKKFEQYEKDSVEQDTKFKRQLYDAEKKFIIGKDKLKKEMEARLLQLAQDFQDATELRIAASTHRVIRENISVNNELDRILTTQTKLAEQNEKFKGSDRASRLSLSLAEEARDKAIKKSVIQLTVIERLTDAYKQVKDEIKLYEERMTEFERVLEEKDALTINNENLTTRVQILEKKMETTEINAHKSVTNARMHKNQFMKAMKIIDEASLAIKAALKLDQWLKEDPSRFTECFTERHVFLQRMMQILTITKEPEYSDSHEDLTSLRKLYKKGDLGFVPRSKTTSTHSQQQDSKKSTSNLHISGRSEDVLSLPFSLDTIPSMKILPALSHESIHEGFPSSKESVLEPGSPLSGTDEDDSIMEAELGTPSVSTQAVTLAEEVEGDERQEKTVRSSSVVETEETLMSSEQLDVGETETSSGQQMSNLQEETSETKISSRPLVVEDKRMSSERVNLQETKTLSGQDVHLHDTKMSSGQVQIEEMKMSSGQVNVDEAKVSEQKMSSVQVETEDGEEKEMEVDKSSRTGSSSFKDDGSRESDESL